METLPFLSIESSPLPCELTDSLLHASESNELPLCNRNSSSFSSSFGSIPTTTHFGSILLFNSSFWDDSEAFVVGSRSNDCEIIFGTNFLPMLKLPEILFSPLCITFHVRCKWTEREDKIWREAFAIWCPQHIDAPLLHLIAGNTYLKSWSCGTIFHLYALCYAFSESSSLNFCSH